ncbi:MAG: thiol:disulfide interchange protein [Sphingomonadaceae bacterium]|nr:thiol:disulfide interchange protein [Sphingomonadaceae bacterium]
MLHLLALLLAGPVLAQGKPTNIRPQLLVEGPAAPGGTVTLAFLMTPDPGWHGYWQNPGDAGLGMTTEWTLPKGTSAGALQYPVPGTLLISGLMNHVYKTEYAVLLPLTLPADARPGARLPIKVKLGWLACTDQVCVPEEAELSAEVTVGQSSAPDARFEKWRMALPAPLGSTARFAIEGGRVRIAIPLPASVKLERPHLFIATERTVDYAAPQGFSRDGDLLLVDLPRAKFDPQNPPAIDGLLRLDGAANGVTLNAVPGAVPQGGTPIGGAQTPALWLLLLSALAGGLLLNVMPCVFPILSLKALSLARAGESEGQARSEGLAYTAGVVLACLALGVLLLALRAAGQEVGWAFQLQEPLVVAALLLLAVMITANLLGVYEFAVPGFASAGSPRDGALGAFATGLLAAFAATPCTGPFMAAAMGAALLLPVPEALALFAMLGLGLALPFLAIAYVPRLRAMLPKPGAWMVTFKKAMAVPMGLTALALVWLSGRLAGNGFAFAAVLIALIVVALLVLLGRRQRFGRAAGGRWWAMLAVVLAFGAAGLPGMVRESTSEVDLILPSQPFSEDALARARAGGKPVFAYFTADWCLTCKVNEAAAIEREETRAAFEKGGVVVLRGDWTRRDPAITRYLTRHGAAGVPLYVWYPAGGGEPQILPQVLTIGTLTQLVR